LNVTVTSAGAFRAGVHWQNLPSYRRVHNPSYTSATLLSVINGFIASSSRVSPFLHELWRTTNGGTSWNKIGEWVHGTATGIPGLRQQPRHAVRRCQPGVMTRASVRPITSGGCLAHRDGGATWEGHRLFQMRQARIPEPAANGASALRLRRHRTQPIGSAAAENIGSYMDPACPAGDVWRPPIRRDLADQAVMARGLWNCSAMGADPRERRTSWIRPYAFAVNRNPRSSRPRHRAWLCSLATSWSRTRLRSRGCADARRRGLARGHAGTLRTGYSARWTAGDLVRIEGACCRASMSRRH